MFNIKTLTYNYSFETYIEHGTYFNIRYYIQPVPQSRGKCINSYIFVNFERKHGNSFFYNN